jgi:hypothetical protein
MSEDKKEGPKTFISYSWSSPEHESCVIDLATELEESGIHVIIDKWDLREGADKYAFMEKIVTDPTVRKVIVVCDRFYAEKADGRKGGVGTETQIISQEIYDQVDPVDQKQKFVAVIKEKDEAGKPYIPIFLKTRIYIDMSDPTLRSQSFEQLLRWIYDKPLHKRPERGKPPAYLFTDGSISLGTTSRFRIAIDALRQNKASSTGAVSEYFNTFAENLETLRIDSQEGQQFDDQVIESIEWFLPYRNEATDLFLAIARYRPDPEMYNVMHGFFEQVLLYTLWPVGRQTWRECDADNFKFILHELFLYANAALLKNRRFDGVNLLVEQKYYIPAGLPNVTQSRLVPFTFFQTSLRSLEFRNRRLSLRRLSLISDIIKERAKRSDLTLEDIMQTDFLLFLRSEFRPKTDDYPLSYWFPESLLYATERHYPFEIFARAQSFKFFEQLIIALGISNKKELELLLEEYHKDARRIPRWDFDRIYPTILMGIEQLATQP